MNTNQKEVNMVRLKLFKVQMWRFDKVEKRLHERSVSIMRQASAIAQRHSKLSTQ